MKALETQMKEMRFESLRTAFAINRSVVVSVDRLIKCQVDAIHSDMSDQSAYLRRLASANDIDETLAEFSNRAMSRMGTWSGHYLQLMSIAGQIGEEVMNTMLTQKSRQSPNR